MTRKLWLWSIALACLFQGDLLIYKELRLGEDLLSLHYPQQLALQKGEFPLSPRFGIGLDLLSEGQSGALSPVNFFLRLFPLTLGFAALTLVLQVVAFLGMGLLLKNRGLPLASCLMGMVAYGGSLCFLLRIEHWHYFQVISFIPFILYGQEKGSGWGYVLSIFFLVLSLLSGGFQFVFLLALLWLVNGFLQNKLNLFKTLLVGGVAGGLAFGQLEAVWVLLNEGERSQGTQYWQHSLPWHHLLGILFPAPFGAPAQNAYLGGGPHWEFALFSGVSTLLIFMRAAPGKYILTAGFFLMLALGEHVPLLREAFSLPPFSYFRVPARFGILFVFFVACGAAHGLSRVLRPSKFFSGLRATCLVFLLIGISGLCFGNLGGGAHFLWQGFRTVIQEHIQMSAHHPSYFDWAGEKVCRGFLIQFLIFLITCLGTIYLLNGKKKFFIVLILVAETFWASLLTRDRVALKDLEDFSLDSHASGLVWINPEDREQARVHSGDRGEPWLHRIVSASPFIPSQLTDARLKDPLHHSPLRSLREKKWQQLLKKHSDNVVFLSRAHIEWIQQGEKFERISGSPKAFYYRGPARSAGRSLEERLLYDPLEASLQLDDQIVESMAIPVEIKKLEGSLHLSLDHLPTPGWVRVPVPFSFRWQVTVGGKDRPFYPADLVMLGFEVPEGARNVKISQKSWVTEKTLVIFSLSLCVFLLFPFIFRSTGS